MPIKTALGWDEFLAAGKPGQRWEYIDGEVQFMSPTGTRHGRAIHQISMALGEYEKTHPEWISFGADVAFTMASGDWLCPDAALVRRDRFGVGGIPEGPAPFPPDVAFEVLSPDDRRKEVLRKRRLYQLNHVLQVWIDPEEQMVEVIAADRPVRYFRREPVVIEELPGFRLDLFSSEEQ